MVAQTQWDRSAPLIVHACSSTTYPTSHYTIYKDIVYPYWTQHPAKYRFALGAYQRCGPPPPCPLTPCSSSSLHPSMQPCLAGSVSNTAVPQPRHGIGGDCSSADMPSLQLSCPSRKLSA